MHEITLRDFILTIKQINDLHAPSTQDHGNRSKIIAQAIGRRLRVSDERLEWLGWSAELHDLGKVFLDRSILNQPTRLNVADRAHIETHARLGYLALQHAPIPEEIKMAVLYHHEHWDGTGYPEGRKGRDIPLFARIVAVADCWDALISPRPYRHAMSFETALSTMNKHSGCFDPKIYAYWLDIVREHERNGQ